MSYKPGYILLDKYRFEALIDQESFGEVYRFTHLGLNVPCVLKVLRKNTPGIGSAEYNYLHVHFQFKAIPDATAFESALAANARANPDTRLALLSRLDTGVKYDPQAMFTAAWERLRLEEPSRYFTAPLIKT